MIFKLSQKVYFKVVLTQAKGAESSFQVRRKLKRSLTETPQNCEREGAATFLPGLPTRAGPTCGADTPTNGPATAVLHFITNRKSLNGCNEISVMME